MSSEVVMLEPKLEGQQTALVREFECWHEIKSQAELDSAVALCLEGRGLVKSIQAFFAPMKQNAHTTWKGICNQENAAIGKVEEHVKRVQRIADDYRTAELRRQQEEARKAQEAERARQAEERRQQEEAALKRAAELEAQGRSDLAEKVLDKAEAIADAPLPPVGSPKVEAPKTAGLGTRIVWEFELEDLSKVPLEFLQLNEPMVKAMIKHRDIPGIRRFERVASSLR